MYSQLSEPSISSPETEKYIDENSVDNSLTDQERLVILIIAVSLFFVTLLITICIVSPCCYISKLIKRLFPKAPDELTNTNPVFKQYISPETKSFQLTVVPQYIEKQKLDLNLSKNEKLNNYLNSQQNEPINLYNNSFNEPSIKRKLLKDIFQSKEINCNTFFLNNKNKNLDAQDDVYIKWNNDKLPNDDSLLYSSMVNGFNYNNLNDNINTNSKDDNQMEIICYLRTEKSKNLDKPNNIRLFLHLKQIKYLPLKSNGLEPSFYCTISGLNTNSTFRKAATNRKLSAKLNSLLYYQSEVFKPRTLNPMLNLKYYSDELTRSALKDAKLLIRIMAVEKYANDYCLGEVVINLKQILNDEKTIERNSFNEKEDVFKCYKLSKPKEIKGEMLLSVCFLPTSRRATFTISKANINNQLNVDFSQNYFVRVIMCCNGKVIKKKKTNVKTNNQLFIDNLDGLTKKKAGSPTKLDWQENETITFDLTNLNEHQLEQLCFLIVLVATQDTVTEPISSPSSPDSPIDHMNGYNGFQLQNNTLETIKKVDKNLLKKDNIPIGHFVLSSELWNQVTHEPRKQIRRWVKLI